ncbi:MAG: NAD-dependent DNA ligase LigA [Thermoguttaceae bacterium]|jgi:DNA ligase (NAD+)
MTREEAQLEIERLTREIRRCDQLYYVEAKPDIPDHEYDALMSRLAALEKEFPELLSSSSPTQRIGEKLDGKAAVFRHETPMLSIANVYEEEDLRKFVEAAQEGFDKPLAWVCELKIDGVACALRYENRELALGLTRGDGIWGEDITANVRAVKDIPLRLPDDAPSSLEVRGELYITNTNLARVNEERSALALEEKREFQPFANARNLTAGTVKQLDPKVSAERRLQFFAHSVGAGQSAIASTHFEFMKRLRKFGFPTAPMIRRFATFERALPYVLDMQSRLHEVDFEVDGVVLKVDDFAAREKIGATSKYPKWIVACKFEKYEAQTRLNNIVVGVGKTGLITPVAELEPVEIAGTTVSRASLYNKKAIERLGVRIGDTVIVAKAGKIIPRVSRVETYLRDRQNPPTPYVFPTHCPSCGSELQNDLDSVLIRCGDPECPAQFQKRLKYFASKEAMDIDGIGPKEVKLLTTPIVRTLFGTKKPLVTRFADLYRLTPEALQELYAHRSGTKKKSSTERSSTKLVDAIQGSKTAGPARLLAALSIREVGVQTAKAVIEEFRSFDAMEKTESAKEFETVDGVGKVVAENLFNFFHSEDGARICAELREQGLVMALPDTTEEAKGDGALAGNVVCVTGTLDGYKHEEIKATIERHGGKATAAVSRNTTFMLVGRNPGQKKIARAKILDIRIVTEEEFDAMIGERRSGDSRSAPSLLDAD